METFEYKTSSYKLQNKNWPQKGKHILAQYTDDYVIVYQAFNDEIANFAIKNQYFGGEKYKTTRMVINLIFFNLI
jgi:hypothetical protein